MKIDFDSSQKLFMITQPGGVSCLSFDVARRDATYIASRLRRTDLMPDETDYGTLDGYNKYQRACTAWSQSALSVDTWFTPGTPAPVQNIIEAHRHSRKLVRLFLGDPQTGRDWMEEHDVVGYIGRSTGGMKVPLLVRHGENGGGAILTDCIVRLMDARSGKELYRAANYQLPTLNIVPVADQKMRAKGLVSEVTDSEGKVHGRFPSVFRAAEYVEFITGFIPTMRDDLERLAYA
jgi:hypothetical protein